MGSHTLANVCALAVSASLAWNVWQWTTPPPVSMSVEAILESGKRPERIASASAVADELLMALAEPDRVVALSGYSVRAGTRTAPFANKPSISSVANTARIVALRPDLLLAHNVTDPRLSARLRESGVPVVDLGTITGIDTLLNDTNEVAALLGVSTKGANVSRSLMHDLRAISAELPPDQRRDGMYLTRVGRQLFGGTKGSSYGDVLHYAGVVDIAADAYAGWPALRAEQILALNPALIITTTDVEKSLCAFPGLAPIAACNRKDGIVAIDSALIGSAGFRMLEAARAVHRGVYGSTP